MIDDPIVQEVRRIRHEHAARFSYDLNAIFVDLKRSESARGQRESPLVEVRHGEAADLRPRPELRLVRFGR